MAFENFRERQAGLLAGFTFTDDDIRDAVRAVRARGLQPLDKYVVAQLKLACIGRVMRGDYSAATFAGSK